MPSVLVIKVAAAVDGTGTAPIPQAALVVEGGAIKAIGTAAQMALPDGPDVETLEATSLCALPGLIDAHVHLVFSGASSPLSDLLREDDETLVVRATRNAQVALCAGITTVRDCGGRGSTVISLRNAIRAGIVTGPRIVASGMPITSTAGHCYWLGLEADGADEVRKAARAMARQGADWLKVMGTGGGMTAGTNARAPQYSVAELEAIVAEGRRLGKTVGIHVHGTAGIRNAVAAGVNTLEHCSWLSEGEGLDFDRRVVDDMARKGIYADPTLVAGYQAFKSGQDLTADRRRLFALREKRLPYFQQMIGAGVKLLAGTDSGVSLTPFNSLPENVAMFVRELGLSPLAAIQAATQYPAEAMGLGDEVGTLQPGRRADVILVEGNPAEDVGALRRVRFVLRDGRLMARDGQLVLSA